MVTTCVEVEGLGVMVVVCGGLIVVIVIWPAGVSFETDDDVDVGL